jgi:hypothetical protein
MTNLKRLETTIQNIQYQKCILWDDLEKLEHLLQNFKDGQKLNDDFEFNDKLNNSHTRGLLNIMENKFSN